MAMVPSRVVSGEILDSSGNAVVRKAKPIGPRHRPKIHQSSPSQPSVTPSPSAQPSSGSPTSVSISQGKAPKRGPLIIMGIVAILAIRSIPHWGPLWKTIWTSSLPASSSSASSSTSTSSSSSGSSGGTPGKGPFGLSNITTSFHVTNYLKDYSGFGTDVGEVNYILPHYSQEPVFLPPGNWQLQNQGFDSTCLGGWQTWYDPNTKAKIRFQHLSGSFQGGNWSASGFTVASNGNVQAGVSGWPLGPNCGLGGIFGPTNAHLSVVYNDIAAKLYNL